jgi:BioD-like phosphotransacetylase family protein
VLIDTSSHPTNEKGKNDVKKKKKRRDPRKFLVFHGVIIGYPFVQVVECAQIRELLRPTSQRCFLFAAF